MKTTILSLKATLNEYFFLHFEWVALTTGLLLMALLDPFSDAESLCILSRLGFEYCPGCGLGTSVSHIFRGEFFASIQANPVGLFAVLIIPARVVSIFHRNYNYKKRTNK
ncbi:MAG: DUF2752 domain-containing protein [Balneolaceae bacterium]